MICDPCRHRWGKPLARIKAEMRRTKIIDTAHHIHTASQGARLPGQRSTSACKRCQMLTKRGIKALDISRIDHTISLRPTSERLDPSCRAVNHTTFNLDHTSAFRSFDHLGNQDVSPRSKPGPSATVRSKRVAKGLTRGPNVGLQAIGANQDRPTKRAAAHPFHQGFGSRPYPGAH